MLACGLKHISAIVYDCEIAQIGAGAALQATKVQEQVSAGLRHAVAGTIIILGLLFYLDLLSLIYHGLSSLIVYSFF